MKKLKIISIIVVTILAVVLISFAAGIFYIKKNLSGSGPNLSYQIVEIKKGDSVEMIADKLYDKNIISSKLFFRLFAEFSEKTPKYGYFQISPKASILEITDQISSGKSIVEKITIPEGWRAEQIAQLLEEKGIIKSSIFLAEAMKHEGKLFPDTYFLPLNANIKLIVDQFTDNYMQRTKALEVSDEDLMIASIVEREAINDQERPLIAGIYKNRLKIGMKLEADPTVQYGKDTNQIKVLTAKAFSEYKFWKPITLKDYKSVDSPFNTYLIPALMPGPICNPGIKSIEAAINYSEHDYLFFLQADGKIYPAKTDAEHNKNRVNVLGAKL